MTMPAARRAKLRVILLANGQIGDITVYSNADRNFVNGCINAVRKTKFIPAERDGRPVDSYKTFEYSYQVFTAFQRF